MKSSALLTAAILVILVGLSPVYGQDTGIPDTARLEPNPAVWTINSDADSLFLIELWGFSDQNIGAMSLGFKLPINGGSGTSHDDSLIVVDTFYFDSALEWLMYGYQNSALDPNYGTVHHGYNSLLVGGLSLDPMLIPSVPTKIGDIQLKILDPYGLPEYFEIPLDSSFIPPAGPFKFGPSRRTFLAGYPPQFTSGLITVENNLGIPIEPVIDLSPDSFEFTGDYNGDNPMPQVMQISNSGNGILDWTATDDADWLTLLPSSGVGDSPCSLVVDITGLPLGQYTATVMVSDPEAINSPQYATVTLNVVNVPAIIALDPTSFLFEAVEEGDNPAGQILSIFNGAKGELNWSASDDADWLTLSPESGVGDGTCTLFVDIFGLTDGDYTATVMVSDPEAPNSPQSASVALHVEDNLPVIVLNPSSFYFEMTVGHQNPNPKVMSITNGGYGQLYWWASSDADWLTVYPVMGGGDGSTTLSIDALDLPVGTYTATVTVTDPAASNDPQTASVLLSVISPPGGQGDDCSEPLHISLPANLTYHDYNTTCGRLNYYYETCLGSYDGGEDIIYKITVDSPISVDLDLDPHGTAYCGMLLDDACPPDPVNCLAKTTSSSGSPMSIDGQYLETGEYFVMIDTWPSPNCIPDFDFYITEIAPVDWGFDCDIPIEVVFPDQLPYVDANQSSCGMTNAYSSTCLGYYDGGEDVLYRLDVDMPAVVMVWIDPKGTAWTGFVLDDNCPPDPADCMALATAGGSGAPYDIDPVYLDIGTYYIMVDTWPSPACIPDYDLYIDLPLPPGELVIDPSEFDFGTVDEGQSGSDILTLENGGGTAIEYSVSVEYSPTVPPEIEGAYVMANDEYVPGTTMDIEFTLANDSQDSEWLDEVTITFPAGVTVNSSTDFAVPDAPGHYLQYDGTTGEMVTVTWFDYNGGYGNIYATEVATATMSLTFVDSLDGDISLNFTISGDEWGGDPHDVSGSFVISQADPTESWLTVTPSSGSVVPGGTEPLTVAWNTAGLYNGTHEADIVISHSGTGGVNIVPVTINVVNGPAKAAFSEAAYYMYYMFAYDPMYTSAYVGNFSPPYTANDVGMVTVNGEFAEIVGVLPSYPGFDGEVVELSVALTPFLEPYGAPVDTSRHPFAADGSFSDGYSFEGAGSVVLIGKYSGDTRHWILPEDDVIMYGDADASGNLDIDDVVRMISLIFTGGNIPGPMMIADCDCSNSVDIDDVVYLITYIFQSGPEPCH